MWNIVKTKYQLHHVCTSTWNNLARTWQFFVKSDIWVFFENCPKNSSFIKNQTKITVTLHEDQYTFLIIPRSFLLRMRNVSEKSCRDNKHILCLITFFFSYHAIYDIMWKNNVNLGRPQMTVWRMCTACRIPKATNTHSEYVKLIALPLQQWLHEWASMLCYTYIAGLVILISERFFSFFIYISLTHK
jgi:hypothetical protein